MQLLLGLKNIELKRVSYKRQNYPSNRKTKIRNKSIKEFYRDKYFPKAKIFIFE